jgi:hypothetical protein
MPAQVHAVASPDMQGGSYIARGLFAEDVIVKASRLDFGGFFLGFFRALGF